MSHCANYILRMAGETIIASTRWGAKTLPLDIFWGPDSTFDFVVSLADSEEPGPLYSELMCEAAVFINYDQQHILLFGGEDLCFEAPLQRVYLRMLKISWSGWEVNWAYRGLTQIASEAEVDIRLEKAEARSLIRKLTPWQFPSKAQPIIDSEMIYFNRGAPRTILTVRGEHGESEEHSVMDQAEVVLLQGPQLVPLIRTVPSCPSVPLMQGARGGAWINEDSKEVHYWLGRDEPSWFKEELQVVWSGWRVVRHQGGMPGQVALSGRDPGEIHISERVLRDFIISTVFGEDDARAIDELVDELKEIKDRPGVFMAPGSLCNPRPEVDAREKRRILAEVLAVYKGE